MNLGNGTQCQAMETNVGRWKPMSGVANQYRVMETNEGRWKPTHSREVNLI
jgi:hypothetical protein